MGMSKAKQDRLKQKRAGQMSPEMNRGRWQRKPQTQVVQNKKAEQRRTQCRNRGSRDGADFLLAVTARKTRSRKSAELSLPRRTGAIPRDGKETRAIRKIRLLPCTAAHR